MGWTRSTHLSLGPLIFYFYCNVCFDFYCNMRFQLYLPSASTVVRKIFRLLGSVEARDR